MFERSWVLFLIIPYECRWCISLILELITRLTAVIPWKVWLKTRVPGSLERIHAHVSPGAVGGDMELSCCSEGTAGSSTALPGCRALPGASTSQIPHKVSHSPGMTTCFLSRHCNLCSGKAAWGPVKPP